MFIECENAFNFNYDIGVSMFGISGGKIHKKNTNTQIVFAFNQSLTHRTGSRSCVDVVTTPAPVVIGDT